ncbi:MAG: hypothetical protein R3F59_06195 [Myxococcota bacterium]
MDEHLAGHPCGCSSALPASPPPTTGAACPSTSTPPCSSASLHHLHAGSHVGPGRPHVHLGLYGLGLAVACALSSAFVVTVDRGGQRYQQAFAQGRRLEALRTVGAVERRGTSIWLVPDRGLLSADA